MPAHLTSSSSTMVITSGSLLLLGLVLCWPCTAQITFSNNGTDTLISTCASKIHSSINSCFTGNSTRKSSQDLKPGILKGLYQCWIDTDGPTVSVPSLRVLLPDIYEDWLRPTLMSFSERYGVPIELEIQPLRGLLDSIIRDAALPPSRQHAVWLQTTLTTQHLADMGISLDLSHLVDSPTSGVEWSDIYQLFRLQLASYRGQIVSMPLDGSTMYLINRKDVFDRLNLTVPKTWQGVLDYVKAYTHAQKAATKAAAAGAEEAGSNRSAIDTSVPPYPLCLPRGASCRRLTMIQAIWSTIAQTHGSQQGVHFDPVTFKPLLDTPAAEQAFRIMAGLLAASAPFEPDEGCTHGSLGFARGQCAMVLAVYVPQMRMLIRQEFRPTVNMSRLSVWPVPGSHEVWDRSGGGSGQLRSCTRDLCPLGTDYQLDGNPNLTRVNHAPLSPGSNLAGAINRGMPLVAQYISWELLAYLASLDRYDVAEPEPLLQTVAPVREHFVATDSVAKWAEAGYDRDVMAAAMTAIAFTRQHPNRAWDLRMPYHMKYNDVLGRILAGLENGSVVLDEQSFEGQGSSGSATQANAASPPPALQGGLASPPPPSPRSLDSALRAGQEELVAFYTRQEYLDKYVASIAFTPSPPSPNYTKPAMASTSASGISRETLVSALVVSTLAVAALAGGGGWVIWRRRQRRRSRGGACDWKQRHKGVSGEPVALVVTDIQDSTTLWEALPADVMSEAVRLHHTCVRRLLLVHGGYESATEGDSFILAFLTARQAVAFAMELQAQLLVQAWPEMLLEHPSCSAVSSDLPEGFPFTSRLVLGERSLRYSIGTGTFRSRSVMTMCEEGATCRSRPPSGNHSRMGSLMGGVMPSAGEGAVSGGMPRWLRSLTMSGRAASGRGAAAALQDYSLLSSSPAGNIIVGSSGGGRGNGNCNGNGGGGGGAESPCRMSDAGTGLWCDQSAAMASTALEDRNSGGGGAGGGGAGGAVSRAVSFSSVGSENHARPPRPLRPVSLRSILAGRETRGVWTSDAADPGDGDGGGSGGSVSCKKAAQYGTSDPTTSARHLTDDVTCSGGDSSVRQSRIATVRLALLRPAGPPPMRNRLVDRGYGGGGGCIPDQPRPRTASVKAAEDRGSFAGGIDSLRSPPSLPSPVAAAPPPSWPHQPSAGLTAAEVVSHARHVMTCEEAECVEEPTALAPTPTDDTDADIGGVGIRSVRELMLAPLSAAPSAPPASSPTRLTQRQLPPPSMSSGATNLRAGQFCGSFLFFTHRKEVPVFERLQRSAPSWKLAPSQSMRVPIEEGMDEASNVREDSQPVQLSPSQLPHQAREQQQQGSQQRHRRQQQQQHQGWQQQLMPSSAVAAAALAATWHAVEDTLPAPAMLLTASVDITDNMGVVYGDTDTGCVLDGDTKNRERSPYRASRNGRQGFSFAGTSLAQRDAELDGAAGGTAAAGGAGSAAAVTAAGLASGKARVRMMDGAGCAACDLSTIETTLTLGQLLKVAAAAPGGCGAAGSSRIARQWSAAMATAAASGVGAAGGPPPAIAVAPSGSSLMTSGINHKLAAVSGLVFRGLRVRVGISWALPSASELQYNTAAARMVYGGPCVAACKALADMAHGGQVLMSETAKEQLDLECGGTGSGRPSGTMILHLGTYELPRPASGGGQRPAGLYSTAVNRPNTTAATVAVTITAATAAATAAAAAAAAAASTVDPFAASPVGLMSSFGASNTQSDMSIVASLRQSPVQLTSGLLGATDTSQTLNGSTCGGGATSIVCTSIATRLTAVGYRSVYWVTSPSLSPRLALLPPLRVPPGATPLCDVYDAPFGHVSFAFVQFPAVSTLLAWNRDVAEEALLVLQAAAAAQLQRVSAFGVGYKAPDGAAGDRGQVCAVFTTAAAAAHWAEGLRRELLTAPWPPELLSHELCEVVEANRAALDPSVSGNASTRRTRRRSLNACFYAEPETAGGATATAATLAAASSPSSRPQSSTQQYLCTAGPSGSNVSAWRCRPGGSGGSSEARPASGGSFATFLMLRRQECRSRRALSQKGLAPIAGAMESSETSGGEIYAGEAPTESGSVTTPVATAAAQVISATTAGAGAGWRRRQICPNTTSSGLSRHYAATMTNVASKSINQSQSFSVGGFILAGAAEAGGSSDRGSNSGNGGDGGAVPACASGAKTLMGPDAAAAPATVAEYGASAFCVPVNTNCPEARSAYSGCGSAQGGSMDGSPGLASMRQQSPFSAIAAASGALGLAVPPWAEGCNGSPREASLLEAAALRRAAEAISPRPDLGVRSSTQEKVVARVRRSLPVSWSGTSRPLRTDATASFAPVPEVPVLMIGNPTGVMRHRHVDEAAAYEDNGGDDDGGGKPPLGGSVSSSIPQTIPIVLLRGLRMRAGIATGLTDWSIQDHTHMLAYHGRPVVAAAKLAAAAASGQVLCDEATRNEAMAEQLWALSLEEEEREAETSPFQHRGESHRGTRGNSGDGCSTAAAAAQTAGLRAVGKGAGPFRPQLLAFTRADSEAICTRKKILSRAYVCRVFDRGGATASSALGERTDDGVPPTPTTAPQMQSHGGSRPEDFARNIRRAGRNRRASTVDGSAVAAMGVTASTAAIALGSGGGSGASLSGNERHHPVRPNSYSFRTDALRKSFRAPGVGGEVG
ncbi:hypothetical protein VaNZ11_015578, partial [Volvox africanus]